MVSDKSNYIYVCNMHVEVKLCIFEIRIDIVISLKLTNETNKGTVKHLLSYNHNDEQPICNKFTFWEIIIK